MNPAPTCSVSAPCYACSYDITRKHAGWRMALYEQLVEWVEAQSGTSFTIARMAYSQPNRCPTVYHLAHHVVHDMHRHGLVRCMRRVDRRCLLWSLRHNTLLEGTCNQKT